MFITYLSGETVYSGCLKPTTLYLRYRMYRDNSHPASDYLFINIDSPVCANAIPTSVCKWYY